ncbi:hypothetical protein [Oleiharenicola lentus]|uniref:hypothetical protein n=1 Tax=Oleiharenicola lentus TaxID=2508720 RepID=UPI003F662839
MKLRLVSFSLLALSLLVVASRAADSAEQVIAKARAYLGGESALTALTSVHLTGNLNGVERTPIEGDATKFTEKNVEFPIDIVFQKPYQQRIVLTRPTVIETTVLDSYEAWQRNANAQNTKQWRLNLLDARGIKRLRANTWENLNFFAGLEKAGGTVTVLGEETVDGKACAKLSFDHGSGFVFVRYFDKDTGRLVKTETENGGEIREEGEIRVKGIRFPKKVINKTPNGQVTTITFNTVVVNESLPASEFAVPSFDPAPSDISQK